MIILDGKKINQEIASQLREAISLLEIKPHLLIIQVGDLESSNIYIKKKIEFGEAIGAKVSLEKFSEDIKEEELISFIEKNNLDNLVNGIIVQLPIPDNLNRQKILDSVSPEKDIDGLGTYSKIIPATTRGILTLLERHNIEISSQKIVIINNSDLIGKPTAKALKEKDAEIVICDENTENIKEITKTADIIVTAIGQPEIIDESYLSKNQVVIDIGISKKDGKIYGDLKRDINIELKAVTPVPGGVGPMTVASLFENLFQASKMQQN